MLVVLSLAIPLNAYAEEQQVKVILRLYDLDGKPLKFMNGYAKVSPRGCGDLDYPVNDSTLTLLVPSRCNVTSWTLIYYGKNHNGKAFFGVKTLNVTWINNTTVIVEGRVNIKPLLIRVVSLRNAGLPNAIVSLGDGTFTFERVSTNQSGYVWIDLLVRKDIDITVFWPPRTAYRLIPKPQARILPIKLINYTNYTIKLNYNLSTVNPVKVINEQGLPGGYTWIDVCGKLYYLTFNNATFNITLKDIVKCEDVNVYYVTPRYADATYDIIELAEKGVLKVRITYGKIYMNKDEALLRLIRSINNFIDLRIRNNTLFPLYVTIWNELYNKWMNTTIMVKPLKPNVVVWTHRIPLAVYAESDMYGFAYLYVYVYQERPSWSYIEYSIDKGNTWHIIPEYERKFKAFKDWWMFKDMLIDVEKGIILDTRGFIQFNDTSFIAFYFRDEFPYKRLVFIKPASTTTTTTSTQTTTHTTTHITAQQTKPSTTHIAQPTTTTSTYTPPKTTTSPITPLNTTITSATTSVQQQEEQGFPWWILVVLLLVVVIVITTIIVFRKKRKGKEKR